MHSSAINLGEYSMKIYLLATSSLMISGSLALAGGYELQTLDTSAMYEDGSFVSLSYASINSDLKGKDAGGTKVKTLKDQTLTNLAFKTQVGDFGLGLTTYRSGAIQMNGSSNSTFTGNSIAGNYIPSANAELNTTAFLVNYNLNDSFSVIGGIKNNALNSFNLTSIYGSYDVSSKSNSAYVVGSAFENPDIALRAEILLQPSSKIKTTGTYTSAAVDFPTAIENMGYTDIPAGVTGSFAATLNTPEMITLNFQSGIAADTLITGSIHQAKWKSSQVNVDVSTVVPAINTAAAVSSDFSDSTKYSIGLARKFSSSLSGSVSYNQEVGSGSTSTSTFTMSNGSKSLNLGFRYSFEQANLSVGVSQTMFNDVTVDANALTSPIEYKNNTATTVGIKLSTNF
jgi:long-subunit fatty acid transport protein